MVQGVSLEDCFSIWFLMSKMKEQLSSVFGFGKGGQGTNCLSKNPS